jgi:hypothetical protein
VSFIGDNTYDNSAIYTKRFHYRQLNVKTIS